VGNAAACTKKFAASRRPASFVLTDATGGPLCERRDSPGSPVNKILKDIIVKSRTLDGYDAPYVPVGLPRLPIEMQVEKTPRARRAKDRRKAFRAACREYAHKQVDAQRAFQATWVLGDWENSLLDDDARFEAEQLRAFAPSSRMAMCTRGSSPCTGA